MLNKKQNPLDKNLLNMKNNLQFSFDDKKDNNHIKKKM